MSRCSTSSTLHKEGYREPCRRRPGVRYQSKLLPLVGLDTVLYAAIPNVSATLARGPEAPISGTTVNCSRATSCANGVGRAKPERIPEMSAAMVDTLRRFSEYLGDEIVLTVDSNGEDGRV